MNSRPFPSVFASFAEMNVIRPFGARAFDSIVIDERLQE